jgi:Alpha amylase, catalytic domain
MPRYYQPDLGSEPDSPFARDANNNLVRRGYWSDMNDRSVVLVMTQGIGADLTNDEKRAHLSDLKREHLIDQVCIQEILPRPRSSTPEVHDVIRGLRKIVDEFKDRLLIGEIYLPLDRLVAYYGGDLKETHLPFNFSLLETRWHAREIAKLIDSYETALPEGGWPNWVLGNHDRPRIATRVGSAQARVAAMLLLTLRGTPTIYYGEEIGLVPASIPPDRIRDPLERNIPGLNLGRDGARTPMQWTSRMQGFPTSNLGCPSRRIGLYETSRFFAKTIDRSTVSIVG